MTARRRGKDGRRCRKSLAKMDRAALKEARFDRRVATPEFVPVRNHRVRNLMIRMSDMEIVYDAGMLPWTENGVTGFHRGFIRWPSLEFEVSQTIRFADWKEDARYDTVSL